MNYADFLKRKAVSARPSGLTEFGLLDWRHWRALTRECHQWVEENPVEARRRGLLCAPGLWNVPDETPVPELPEFKTRLHDQNTPSP